MLSHSTGQKIDIPLSPLLLPFNYTQVNKSSLNVYVIHSEQCELMFVFGINIIVQA